MKASRAITLGSDLWARSALPALAATMLFGLNATDPAAFGIDAGMLASAELRYD